MKDEPVVGIDPAVARRLQEWSSRNWHCYTDSTGNHEHCGKFYWCRRQGWILDEDFTHRYNGKGDKQWGFRSQEFLLAFILRWA